MKDKTGRDGFIEKPRETVKENEREIPSAVCSALSRVMYCD